MIRVILTALVFSLLTITNLVAEDRSSSSNGGDMLPRGLALHELDNSLPHTDDPTPPPREPVRTIAEWEENEAIFFRWGEHNGLLADIIDYVVDVTKAYIVVSNQSQANSCRTYLINQGVAPIDSVEFFIAPTNSVWIRDYAPWWFWRLESWDRGMYEWDYNRPRPQDDVIPEWLSQLWGIQYYGMDLTHTGGNWLIDGQGNAYCSQLILQENWGLTATDVNEMFYSYASIDTVPLTPTFFGIDHLNMSAKLLNDHTVLVNEYPQGSPHTAAMDQTVEIFSSMTNQYGQPFEVYRVPTPDWVYSPFTYCNSLIVQNRVLVPTYNQHPYDEDALAIYAEHMPGYEIYGINCSSIISLSGAINCITSNVPHPSLIHITSAPLPDTPNITDPYLITADIVSLGTLNPDSLFVIWRSNSSPNWSSEALINTVGDTFEGYIPAYGEGYVYYYIYAQNLEGNWTTLPRYGPVAHNSFHTGLYPVEVTLEPTNPPVVIPSGGGSFEFDITLSNTGSYPVSGDAWIDIELPNGGTALITLREDVLLNSAGSIARQLTQNVPPNAPEGSYFYHAAFGNYPDEIFAEDSFAFVKETGSVAVVGEDNWDMTGWDEESPETTKHGTPFDPTISTSVSPNPFNPSTVLSYKLQTASKVNLSVYDISGRLVAELVKGWRDAGTHQTTFDGSNLASGIYLYRIKAGDFSAVGKMVLIK